MFSTHLKKIMIATVIASLSLPALAEVKKESKNGYNWLISTDLKSILKTAEAGEGYKLEGQKKKLEGWLAGVDTTKAKDGTTLYILQIAESFNVDLPGLRPNTANPNDNLSFFCVTADRGAVQKLDKNKLVAFNAEIREIKSGGYKQDFGATSAGTRMTSTVKQNAVLAKCDF